MTQMDRLERIQTKELRALFEYQATKDTKHLRTLIKCLDERFKLLNLRLIENREETKVK